MEKARLHQIRDLIRPTQASNAMRRGISRLMLHVGTLKLPVAWIAMGCLLWSTVVFGAMHWFVGEILRKEAEHPSLPLEFDEYCVFILADPAVQHFVILGLINLAAFAVFRRHMAGESCRYLCRPANLSGP